MNVSFGGSYGGSTGLVMVPIEMTDTVETTALFLRKHTTANTVVPQLVSARPSDPDTMTNTA